MSYDEEGLGEERSFKMDMDDDEMLEPLEGNINDFRFDEEADEDPDKDH